METTDEYFLVKILKAKATKAKLDKLDYKKVRSKGTDQKKWRYRPKNMCILPVQQIKTKNLSATQKNSAVNREVVKRPEQTVLIRRNAQQIYEKVINTIRYKENAVQNHFTPVRMAIIQRWVSTRCWQECGDSIIHMHCRTRCKLA